LAAEGCSRAPVGTCNVGRCIPGRNADCKWMGWMHGGHRCMCREHFCALQRGTFAGGVCRLPEETWSANVTGVTASQPQFPEPHDEIDTAICLSGGGSRAGSLTIGVFRALENLGLMSSVDAISSVSGSLFVSIPYMFADETMYRNNADFEGPLWGFPTDPRQLTLHRLDWDTSPMGTQFSDGYGGTWGTVNEGLRRLLPDLMANRGYVSSVWRHLMRTQFLHAFGLGSPDCFLARDAEAEAEIKRRNPELADFCFLKPLPGKPKAFVINAALLAPETDTKRDAFSFQIAPDYTGSPFYANLGSKPAKYQTYDGSMGLRDRVVGGGLIETFAFGGTQPASQAPGLQTVPSPHRPFSLADAMSIATYADFLPSFERMALWRGALDFTPSYEYWPIGQGAEPARRFWIGDAGFIEDTGLLTMLQRKARRVALFLFAGPGQQINGTDYCGLDAQIQAGTFDPQTFQPGGKIADSLYTIYGYPSDDGKWHKSHNTVFEQSEMFSVACELQKLKNQGKPQVYKRTQVVKPNPYWGITPYSVEILYVYSDKVPEFERLLPKDTQASLQTDMKGFPTDLPAGLFLKPRIIQLMAAQSEYMILQNQDLFRELFRKSA